MSEQQKFEPILNDEETLIITRITQADAPYNQRAQALLAINAGKSEEEAGEATGLRPTQVKYWVSRYRKSGLEVFPDALLVEAKEAVVVVEEMVEEEKTAVIIEETIAPKTEQEPAKKKAKKKKKGSKGKKSKKAKSDDLAESAPSDKKKKQKKGKKKKKKHAKKSGKGKKSKKSKKKKGKSKKK